MRSQPFEFDQASDQFSRAIRHDGGRPVRVAARVYTKAPLNVQLQMSRDRVNWSALGTWQAPGPCVASFEPLSPPGGWLRARAWTNGSGIVAELALEVSTPEDEEKKNHGR